MPEPIIGFDPNEAPKSLFGSLNQPTSQENMTSHVEASAHDTSRPSFFTIHQEGDKFVVTTPGGYTDKGAIASYRRTVDSREEAERILREERENFNPRVELISIQKSFTTFHSIRATEDGRYIVTFPALRSFDNPNLLVGASSKSYDTWEEARDFYLESRNLREYPEEAVFQLKMNGVDYRFSHLNTFGQRPRLADKPIGVSEKAKAVLDFDSRNTPNPESAHTYYKTLEMPDWQDQVFRFIENYTKTPEGRQLVEKLGIKDLTLLTPQLATQLTLEVVTRLKKYNLAEMGVKHGETDSDQNNALYLLRRGLREKDSDDFKGNGICRNFASTVKVVFEAIKANQTKFNYLQDTYVFYESGPRADFDPSYEAQSQNAGVTLRMKEAAAGHAWNSFVTVGENDISQTVVDATWSNFDYDTQQSIKLDYTVQRMEKDVYRNLKRKDTEVDAEQAAQLYIFLLDSLPQQEGLVLDKETVARAKESNFYSVIERDIKSKYEGLSPDQYDNFALKMYKKFIDMRSLETNTQFYLGRAMEVIKRRESELSEDSATEITRLVAETKQDIGYFEVLSVYALPTRRVQDRQTVVAKYVKAWEDASKRGYAPPRNLVFGNKEIQDAVFRACSSATKAILQREIG